MRYQKIHVCIGEKPTNKNTIQTKIMELYNSFNLVMFISNLLPQPKELSESTVTIVAEDLVGSMLASVQFQFVWVMHTSLR